MIDPQERMAAKLERRDPRPPETPVKVRVRTSSDSFVWRGYTLAHEGQTGDTLPASLACHDRYPVAYGVAEVDMYPSDLEALRREVAARAPTDSEIEYALNDLKNHIAEIAEPKMRIGETVGVKRLWELLTSGDLSGKTSRHFRPSFSASFSAANRGKELFPVISVDVVSDEPKATANTKR